MSQTLLPPAVVPAVVVSSTRSVCSLSTMLITPAIASEPYWAAAPSRSTSIRSMADVGIAFKSTPTVPRPNVPLTNTSALVCRRLPLTRTSTWSGPRPRRLAGLMWSVPSAMVWCDALNDGATVAVPLAMPVCCWAHRTLAQSEMVTRHTAGLMATPFLDAALPAAHLLGRPAPAAVGAARVQLPEGPEGHERRDASDGDGER